jgi:hypothetical protein
MCCDTKPNTKYLKEKNMKVAIATSRGRKLVVQGTLMLVLLALGLSAGTTAQRAAASVLTSPNTIMQMGTPKLPTGMTGTVQKAQPGALSVTCANFYSYEGGYTWSHRWTGWYTFVGQTLGY